MPSPDYSLIRTGEATAILDAPGVTGRPIAVIGTSAILQGFDDGALRQAVNSRMAPGITDLVLNPDAHVGYGAPVGCVMASPSYIYPGPVGVDIKCSMSLLQLDLPRKEIDHPKVRRKLIRAITQRTPTGAGQGQRSVPHSRPVSPETGHLVVTQGASRMVCEKLGIPSEWAERCEDAFHLGHDGRRETLEARLAEHLRPGVFTKYPEKIRQLGSYGSGNHFGECEIVDVADNEAARAAAEVFGLQDGCVAFLSHCGSRGFGFTLASAQFRHLEQRFREQGIPFPAGDRQLVYAPLGTPDADAYIDDMALAGNFATVNHLLINALVLEAFQKVFPGVNGRLVYLISHNIARREILHGEAMWVHRKGATRAFPAGHPALAETPFAGSGHPILLPGNPQAGSAVMVAEPGAEKSCFSVNHGAGRRMGRRAAFRNLDQAEVDHAFRKNDILTNCASYPRDEAPAAYKDFHEVLRSVEKAGLARKVASLTARFVIKDADKSQGGAA